VLLCLRNSTTATWYILPRRTNTELQSHAFLCSKTCPTATKDTRSAYEAAKARQQGEEETMLSRPNPHRYWRTKERMVHVRTHQKAEAGHRGKGQRGRSTGKVIALLALF
jgi:hypothetical protein